MTVDIIVAGVAGRMGKEIARAVLADPDTRLVGCTEIPDHPLVGQKLSPHVGVDDGGVVVAGTLDGLPVESAVVIDFTTPEATRELVERVRSRGGRMVIGTTGLSAEQMAAIDNAAKHCAVLYSPNMSLGVNLLFYLTEFAAERLGPQFDIEIVEAHHRMKKDSPSGTAKRLAEIAAKARGLSYEASVRHGRSGMVGERSHGEIGMHAIRAGDIVGDHSVLFAGPAERLELKHMAHSRSSLAQGAIAAAKWLHAKKPGLYSMREVLGL